MAGLPIRPGCPSCGGKLAAERRRGRRRLLARCAGCRTAWPVLTMSVEVAQGDHHVRLQLAGVVAWAS